MTFPSHPTILLAAGLCATSAPAFAHAHLASAVPPVNGTVTAAPNELVLFFSEGVSLRFTGAKLSGPDKAVVTTGEPRLGAGGAATLVVPLTAPLAAGAYTVEWHALATDGHKTRGSYTFSVKP